METVQHISVEWKEDKLTSANNHNVHAHKDDINRGTVGNFHFLPSKKRTQECSTANHNHTSGIPIMTASFTYGNFETDIIETLKYDRALLHAFKV